MKNHSSHYPICTNCHIKIPWICNSLCGTYVCNKCHLEYYFDANDEVHKGHNPECNQNCDIMKTHKIGTNITNSDPLYKLFTQVK